MDIDLSSPGMDEITGQRVDAFFLSKHKKSLMNSLYILKYLRILIHCTDFIVWNTLVYFEKCTG